MYDRAAKDCDQNLQQAEKKKQQWVPVKDIHLNELNAVMDDTKVIFTFSLIRKYFFSLFFLRFIRYEGTF